MQSHESGGRAPVAYAAHAMTTRTKEHWERVYAEKDPAKVSWFQAVPARSLERIDAALAGAPAPIPAGRPWRVLDVGGGASSLVDHLARRPDVETCVIDISARALETAKLRLGDDAARVRWIEADIAGPLADVSDDWADVWHDRAAFHFLTDPDDRVMYAANLARILRPGGAAIIAAFAPDGPTTCSGLPVQRHDGASIRREFERAGAAFTIEHEGRETHTTPSGSTQSFIYATLRRV